MVCMGMTVWILHDTSGRVPGCMTPYLRAMSAVHPLSSESGTAELRMDTLADDSEGLDVCCTDDLAAEDELKQVGAQVQDLRPAHGIESCEEGIYGIACCW